MFNDKFYEVLKYEGAVSVVTWANGEGHVSNTWNSYLRIPEDGVIYIPAAGMLKTEANININNNVKLTIGTKEVEGFYGPGSGFLIEGSAMFIESGDDFDKMHTEMPFMTRLLKIDVNKITQTL